MSLEIDQLEKDYGDGLGLAPISFTAEAGELILVVGHNGAGKSTLIGLCAGTLEPTSGSVRVDGHDLGTEQARAAIANIPDHPVLYDDLSLLEHIEYISRLHGTTSWEQRASDLLEQLDLTDRAGDLPARFSRGMRQKASIVLALVRPFSLLLVDEPFVGLDAPAQKAMVDLLEHAASGATVLVASHQLDLADRASRCLGLRDGHLVHDGPSSADTVRGLVVT